MKTGRMPRGAQPKGKTTQARKASKPNTQPQKPSTKTKSKDAVQDARIRKLEQQSKGPEVKETWSTTVNLGTVSGTESDGFTRVAHVFLHPALLRDVDASDATNPTAIRASQYAMYRVSSVELALHSLVGSSGVAGSISVAALQLDPSTGAAVSFDAVAARQHVTTSIGRNGRFRPRLPQGQDSWFFTDTKSHTGAESLGQALEVFLLGATNNIYTNQSYTGALWRLTLRVSYQFSNYKPDLQLAALAAGQETHDLKVATTDEGNVIISTEQPLLGARFHTSNPGIADVVFSLVDVAGGLASQIPIIGPLLDTGLGFLKPLFGRARDGAHQYLLCSSFDEAKVGDPITLPDKIDQTVTGEFRMQQLTPANLGATASTPIQPSPSPGEVSLPVRTLSMAKFPTGNFAVTIPSWTKTVTRVANSAGNFSITLTTPVVGSTTAIPSGDAANHTTGKKWPLWGYSNQSIWKWELCKDGRTSGANACIIHIDANQEGSLGLLGTADALANNPGVLPDVSSQPTSLEFGWSTIASTEGLSAHVLPGDRVIPVHFNNWFHPDGATRRQATYGWMFQRASNKSVFVIGAYHLPSGVDTPGNGVAHFYTLMDTRGYTTYGTRNSDQVAAWLSSQEL
uniref:Structural polyprotein n=1 Tax=Bat bastrovirus TaxID=2169486 RepID=A0A2Z4EVR2_9VIRU|nr:structural polyprotein [Bat bastrovirus]